MQYNLLFLFSTGGNQRETFDEEELEDIKGVIRIRTSKKNRQHNGQKKVQKDKQRSTKHTHKTKYRVTRTPLKTAGELWCSGRVNSSCSTSGTRRVNLVTKPLHTINNIPAVLLL